MINILYSRLIHCDNVNVSGFDRKRLLRIEKAKASVKDEIYTTGLLIEKIRPQNSLVYYRKNGRPAFTKYCNIHDLPLNCRNFSVTHSGGLVLCAYSDQFDIGADYEPAGRKIIDKITRKLCSDSEVQAFEKLSGDSDRQLFLLKLFTRKEAVSKLLGNGLYMDFTEIIDNGFLDNFQSSDFSSEIEILDDAKGTMKKYMIRTLDFEKGYLSLAYEPDKSAQDDLYELKISGYTDL